MVFQCFTVVYFCTRCKINAKINSNYDQTISKMVFFAYKATQYIVNFKIYKQKQVEKSKATYNHKPFLGKQYQC